MVKKIIAERNNVVSMKKYLIELEEFKKEYEDLYHWLKNDYEDISFILKQTKAQQDIYWSIINNMSVQLSYTIENLEKIGWKDKSSEEQEDILWNLGIDVKNYSYGKATRRILEDTKIILTPVVYGQERLDTNWCNSVIWDITNFRYIASAEARELHQFRIRLKRIRKIIEDTKNTGEL